MYLNQLLSFRTFITGFYAALLPRRGPHYASHSVCPSVCPSVPLSLPSVTSRHLANYNDTHALFGTYGHLGRTDSCFYMFSLFANEWPFCCMMMMMMMISYVVIQNIQFTNLKQLKSRTAFLGMLFIRADDVLRRGYCDHFVTMWVCTKIKRKR